MITLDDVEQMIGDGAVASLENVIDATACGMLMMPTKLCPLIFSGNPATAVLNRLRAHFQNLHLTQGHIENGMSRKEALRLAFRPPLHLKCRSLSAKSIFGQKRKFLLR